MYYPGEITDPEVYLTWLDRLNKRDGLSAKMDILANEIEVANKNLMAQIR